MPRPTPAVPPHPPSPSASSDLRRGAVDLALKIRLLTRVDGCGRLLSSTPGSGPCSCHWLSIPLASDDQIEPSSLAPRTQPRASCFWRQAPCRPQHSRLRPEGGPGGILSERSHGVATGVSPAVSGRGQENAGEPDATDARGCGKSRQYL